MTKEITGNRGEKWLVPENIPGALPPASTGAGSTPPRTLVERIAEIQALPKTDREAIATAIIEGLEAEAKTLTAEDPPVTGRPGKTK